MASDQQFCLRWNNHQNTLVSILDSLLDSGTLVDCTLAAEGRFLQAHKVVLSACSPYFAMLLREHYDKFPILILKDIKYQELQAMMNYMYRGEVNITQETLGSFLKAAESLQIRGLTDNSNNNHCVENNNGVVRDGVTHPYHHSSSSNSSMSKKLNLPDSRKLVVPPHTPPLLSQQQPPPSLQPQQSPLQQQPPPPPQRSRSPALLSQPHHKKYLKSPATILENHHNPGNAATKSSESSSLDTSCSSSSTKRRKLLPPIKSESLVVTPINPAAVAAVAAAAAASPYNNLDVNCSSLSNSSVNSNGNNEASSQQPQLQPPSSLAPEGKANTVSSPSGPPKVESPHMDVSPVAAPLPNKVSAAAACAEPLIKPKPLAELVKVKSEQLDDSYNEDTNDDSQNTEDNCDIDRDENSQLGGTMPFPNSQSAPNFELLERSLVSQDGSLQDTSAFAHLNPYWMSSWEYNSKYVRLTETNPFSCQHCGKRYRWKSTLKRHESFECGGKEPAHKCPHCDYRAKQSGNLRVHIRKYHNERNSLAGSVGSAAAALPVVNDMLPATSDKASPEIGALPVRPKTKEQRKANMVAPPPSSAAVDIASRDEDSVGDQQTLLNQTAACYSDSADSDQSKHYSKKRFSPFQVETLKRVFGQSPYITQSQAAALARRTGLKKLQVRKWFSDYRCKIKKQSILLEQFSAAHAAAVAAAAAAAAKASSTAPASNPAVTISLLDNEEPEPDNSYNVAIEEPEQEDMPEGEEDACEEEEGEEEEEEGGNEEEEVEGAASEEPEAEEEADADDDTDVDLNAEIDQMIAARSVRPITIVFGKRSRKRAKKREKERSPGGIVAGPVKRGRKKKKKDGGSDSGGGCSIATDNQSQTVKRFSPQQVEMLKKAYADSPYITQRQAAVLARSIGLKKMQVRKWFCDHRCKIKKQSLRLQTEGFGPMEVCERKAATALVLPVPAAPARKSLLDRLSGGDQPRVDVKVEDDDENVDFTDSDDPYAANGLDDPKGGQSMSKSRISLPKRTFRFNEKQLAVLNEEFDKSQFLNDDTLTFLCDKLQERRERIQTWFKMRRYKLRQSEQRFWQNIMDSS